MNNLDLSIIVPCYNAEQYIHICLSTLVSQGINPRRYEIIVVDDGSKDNSLKVAKDFARNHPHIHIIKQENQGVSVARDAGIDLARGSYIYFIDADDYLAQDTLDKILDYALMHDLDVLSFKSLGTKERNLYLSTNLGVHQINDSIYNGVDFIANHPITNTVWWFIFKKALIKKNNLHFTKGRFIEDVPYLFELLLASERVSSTNLDVHRFYENPHSVTRSKESPHYNKMIDDIMFAAIKIDEIIDKLDKRNDNMTKCIEKIKESQHFFIFILLVRLIKSTMHYHVVKVYIKELIDHQLYPITHFPGKGKSSFFIKLAVCIFNRPFLLLPFTYSIKALNIGKYLHPWHK